jgi:hypothetical protein
MVVVLLNREWVIWEIKDHNKKNLKILMEKIYYGNIS